MKCLTWLFIALANSVACATQQQNDRKNCEMHILAQAMFKTQKDADKNKKIFADVKQCTVIECHSQPNIRSVYRKMSAGIIEGGLLIHDLNRRPTEDGAVRASKCSEQSVQWVLDGTHILTYGQRIVLRDINGKEIATFDDDSYGYLHIQPIGVLKNTRNDILICFLAQNELDKDDITKQRDWSLYYFDVSGKTAKRIVDHVTTAGMLYHEKDPMCLTGHANGKVERWDMQGEYKGLLTQHQRPLHTIVSSGDGKYFVTADEREVVVYNASGDVWDIEKISLAVPEGGEEHFAAMKIENNKFIILRHDLVQNNSWWKWLPGNSLKLDGTNVVVYDFKAKTVQTNFFKKVQLVRIGGIEQENRLRLYDSEKIYYVNITPQAKK